MTDKKYEALITQFQRISSFVSRHGNIFRIVVTVVLFTVLFRTIDFADVVNATSNSRPVFLAASLSLMVPNLLLQVLKWRYILHAAGVRPSWFQICKSVFGGFFIGAVSPGRTGEIARGVYLRGESVVKMASLTIVDKGFNQATTVIVGLLSLSLLVPWPWSVLPIAVDIAFIASLFNLHRLEPLIKALLNKITTSAHVDNALAAFDTLNSATVRDMILYSIAFYMVYVLQFYLMILAFVDVPPTVMIRTLPVVYLINLAFPVSFGDFGVKETAAVNLLIPFGITGEAVFGAAVINNVVTFLIPSTIGGLMTAFHRSAPAEEDHPSS